MLMMDWSLGSQDSWGGRSFLAGLPRVTISLGSAISKKSISRSEQALASVAVGALVVPEESSSESLGQQATRLEIE